MSDAQIRAVADDEAGPSDRQHIDSCGACRARVDAARRAAHELSAIVATVRVPASISDGALLRRSHRAGATTLRDAGRPGVRLWVTAGAVATAMLLVVFALPPLDAPRATSAAEILDKSLQTLNVGSGVELREFDLDLSLPKVAGTYSGTYRIEQLVDHGTPGRYRAIRYAPDGTLLEAISEDPGAARRDILMTVDGQAFAFRFTTGSSLALRDLERHHIQAMIRLLQAAAGGTLREVEGGGSKRYVVELPSLEAEGKSAAPWELSRARAVIDANDFQILELSAAGFYLGEPFSMAFRLRGRQVWSSAEVPPAQFELPAVANAITLHGVTTHDSARDLLATALRELARSRR